MVVPATHKLPASSAAAAASTAASFPPRYVEYISRDPSGASLAANPCGHGVVEYGIKPVLHSWSPGYPAAACTSGKSADAVLPATSALPAASIAIAVPESACEPPSSVE